jgi:hypothetical protein
MPDVYKIDIQVFDVRLESETTNPDIPVMTVQFSIGNEPFTTTNTWLRKPNGWFLNLPK